MPSEPQFTPEHIASDIERLTHELEAKRQQLASASETHEDKELLRQVIGERIQAAVPVAVPPSSVVVPDPTTDENAEFPNYLAGANSDVKSHVHQLIQIAMHSGIEKAVSRAKAESTYVLDAFHDALVDKLYNELKGRGVFR
jgi:hypothetical protein